MTTPTPPPEKKEPRDAAFWAKSVEKMEVSEVPEGAANLNVHGKRAVGALQGFGKMWQKTYRVPLTGLKATPAEVVQVWKEKFPEFTRRRAGSIHRSPGSRRARCCSSTPPSGVCQCTRGCA